MKPVALAAFRAEVTELVSYRFWGLLFNNSPRRLVATRLGFNPHPAA